MAVSSCSSRSRERTAREGVKHRRHGQANHAEHQHCRAVRDAVRLKFCTEGI